MGHAAKINKCRSEEEFFDRFRASHEQRLKYISVLLSIEHDQCGEGASSFGYFIHRQNKCLYKVYGDQCSMWDFNGQFQPELISFSTFEWDCKRMDGLREADREHIDRLFEKYEINRGHTENLTEGYLAYLAAKDIGKPYSKQLRTIVRDDFEQVFKENKVFVEDGICYYEFNLDYGDYPSLTVYVDFGSGDIRLSSIDDGSFEQIKIMMSDIIGSLELKENVFSASSQAKSPASPRAV